MGRKFPKLKPCQHTTTVTVTTAGLERGICEDCGHVAVKYESLISGQPVRENFARPSETGFLSDLGEAAEKAPGRHSVRSEVSSQDSEEQSITSARSDAGLFRRA